MYLPVLETPRLLLRAPRAEDVAGLVHHANDWEVARMTRCMPYPYVADSAVRWIDAQSDLAAAEIEYNFVLLHDGLPIGAMGLMRRSGVEAELGYWLGRTFWRQGLAGEAAQAVVRFGFAALQLDTLYADCLAENVASAALLQRLGMTQYDEVHEQCRPDREPVSILRFCLNAQQWQDAQDALLARGAAPSRPSESESSGIETS
ncbi:GNAT family N-acetyltransferase [Chitiniphilus shinanonensis]|uniref:GNAT family N-acetyltransferase n=1 Tax=Chitiniphilus shinanonensis TaxID=553088 RepID=UPI003031D321